MAQQTLVEWLEERLTLSLGDEIKYLRGFFKRNAQNRMCIIC